MHPCILQVLIFWSLNLVIHFKKKVSFQGIISGFQTRPMLKFNDWCVQQSQSFSSQFPWQRMWHACSFYRGREPNPFHFHCTKMLLPSIYSQCLKGKNYINAKQSFFFFFFSWRSECFLGKICFLFIRLLSLRLVWSYLTMAITAAPAPARAQTNKWNVMLSYSKNTSQHTLVFSLDI